MTKKEILKISNIELPLEEAKRQAIASITGYVYQFHQAASEWIKLEDNEELYLEIAEDHAKIIKDMLTKQSTLIATQVKNTFESGPITLNSLDVQNCIQKLFIYKQKNPDKNIRFCFLTTSEISKEKNNKLQNGEKGIYIWNNVNDDNIHDLRSFLLKSSFNDDFSDFIQNSSNDVLKDFIQSLTFLYEMPNISKIETLNKKMLCDRRDLVSSTLEAAEQAYIHLVYEVIDTIVNSNDRKLTKEDFVACFRKATSIPLGSQIVEDILKEKNCEKYIQMDNQQLRTIAERLLNNSLPSDLSLMFTNVSIDVHNAHKKLMECERYLTEYNDKENETSIRCLSYKILNEKSKKNIYYADPGSGKTYTLWNIAKKLLDEGDIIPLFLPIGNLNTWDEVLSILSSICPEIDPKIIINQPRICLCLDGWSEFATGQYFSERTKATISLANAYVIANARYVDSSDAIFRRWKLENIEQSTVVDVLKTSNIFANDDVLNFLQTPLALLLFIFLGGVTSVGELLHKFHNHITHNNFPENFQYILCDSIRSMILSGDLNYLNFETELKKCAHNTKIFEPLKLLKQLGTIKERNGKILPIHDLYWSWLGGIGLFQNDKLEECINNLKTRESIELALDSGEKTTQKIINKIVPIDIYLATKLDKQNISVNVDVQIEKMLKDRRLAVRYRAAISVISCGRSKYIEKSLYTISEMCKNKIYAKELKNLFKPDILFPFKEELTKWAGSPGTSLMLDAIIETGNQDWLPWLEVIFKKEGVNKSQVIAAAIASAGYIPIWSHQYLFEFIKNAAYKLQDIKRRGEIRDLVKWLFKNYENIVIPSSSQWYHINEYIAACGSEEDFEQLLIRFPKLNKTAQELIEYAIVKRGEPWIGRFQKLAFSEKQSRHHHSLQEVFSKEIEDAIARQWIENGYVNEGWRVLVRRHQNDIVPELIKRLPDSFSEQHYIPTLSAMQYLDNAPDTLINEIYSRFRGTMQPMATEDALIAISRVKPGGVASLVRWIVDTPSLLPAFHLYKVLEMYLEWSAEFKIELMLKTQNGNEFTFIDHIVYSTFHYHKDDHLFAEIISYKPEFAIKLVLSEYKKNDIKSKEILSKLKPLNNFNYELFNRMISSKLLAPLIPALFSEVLNSLPVEILQKLIDSKYIKFENILWQLSNNSNVNHKKIHIQLLKKIIKDDINIYYFSYVGNMLRSYSREKIFDILNTIYKPKSDNFLFFVRELEHIRQERLINENGGFYKHKD